MSDRFQTANIRQLPPRLPPEQFWGLVAVTFFLLQLPFVRIPVMFLSTWAHEFGHGLGALMTGGRFIQLQVLPDFSGIATTATDTRFARAIVVIVGLLGPSLLGVLLLFLTRGLNWYRVALVLLALLLALSFLWAADGFTRLVLSVSLLVVGLSAWKLPNRVAMFAAHIVAIALCLNAVTMFGYFFVGNAEVAGELFQSDTGVLQNVIGGPYWLWGAGLAALSIAILFFGVVWSDRWARGHGRA